MGGPGVSVGRIVPEVGEGCEGPVDGGAGVLVVEDGGIEGVLVMLSESACAVLLLDSAWEVDIGVDKEVGEVVDTANVVVGVKPTGLSEPEGPFSPLLIPSAEGLNTAGRRASSTGSPRASFVDGTAE